MSFPADPQDLRAELHLDGDWRDVTTHVLQRGGLATSRGRSGEDGAAPPSRCQFQLLDTAGDYNPRNPLGQWYGSIGRNTPFRLRIVQGTDTFTRTSVDSWGTSEIATLAGVAIPWSSFSTDGIPSDYQVAAGVATHLIDVAANYRVNYLGVFSRRRVDVAVTVTLPFTNVTGANIEPANILLGGVSSVDYHMVRVSITTAEAVTVQLMHADGTAYSDVVTVAGLTHSSAQALRVRAQMEGAALRAKVWAASGGEPVGWHVSAGVGSKGPARAGWVGVRSGVAAGNTNIPVTFSYDDFEVGDPRYAGEVVKWEPRRDTTGLGRYVPVEASGILRRLAQGSPPLRSALARATAFLDPVAYWPCEDTSGATTLASGVIGGAPMTINGSPRLASSSDFACSDALPVMGESVFDGPVPPATATGELQLRFLMHVDSSDLPTDTSIMARINTSATAVYLLRWGTGGTLTLEARTNNVAETLIASTAIGGFDVNDRLIRASIELTQVGADVTMKIATLEVGRVDGNVLTATAAGVTLGSATSITMAQHRLAGGTVLGHITVQDSITSLFDLVDELNAFDGETAIDRIERLCDENSIPVVTHGVATDSMTMGPQRVNDLLSLLAECAEADRGVLHDALGDIALSYMSRTALYSQDATLTASFGDHELQPGWAPLEDDRNTANDVTVIRTGGTRARAVLESGAMSTAPPGEGGVGLYDTTDTVNVYSDGQLFDVASWLLALGTVDEPRFAALSFARESNEVVADTTLSTGLLDLDIGSLLVVTDLENADIYDDVHQIVIGYEEFINRFNHAFLVDCSPASVYRVLQFDDAEFGRLDSEVTTLAEALDTTETGVDVAIATSGTLWTTDAADMPFDVITGGEVMRVTAVSGAASPQTFTVVRSINGVVKAHDIGQSIHLARRNRFGL